MSAGLVNTIIALVALAFLAWVLYRPKIQGSVTYKAMVVPLANIMDVGFLVLSPIIVVLVGFDAPLVMLGICLLAILAGFAISYNIRHYEPLIGKPDRLHGWNSFATWALIAASIVNIAYYSQLLTSLVLLPGAIATNIFGLWLARRVPAVQFYKIAYVLVFIISIALIWQGIHEMRKL